MTFTPVPKDELLPLGEVIDRLAALSDEVASRLHYAAEAANWAAGQIAALYAALPDTFDAIWIYVGENVSGDPGSGSVAVKVNPDQSRTFALSKTAAASTFDFEELKQGSTVVLTDDPDSPPVTAFRQYTVTADPQDHGSWISFDTVRIATFGTLTTPTVGASVRLILR